jgi:hypothetical protein
VRARGTAAAIAVFAAAWLGLMGLKLTTDATDVPLYHKYGAAIVHGHVPYRDFHVEYPPAALVAFALPAAASTGDRGYRIWFELLMGLCGAGILVATAAVASRLGSAVLPAVVFVGAGILALAPVTLGHFDLWPALLLSAALAALLHGRRGASGVLLGVAVAAKVYPVVAAPLVVAWLWRTHGRRAALRWTAVAVAAAAACFLPFFALAPHGVVSSITGQANRPLQLESSASAALLALHQVAGLALGVAFSHSSANLGGRSGDAAATLTTVAELATLAALLVGFARARRSERDIVLAALAAVLAFVALGKVFSPQFLLWLVPLAPLAGGALAVTASALVGSAVILTRLYFPGRWHDLILFEALPTWLLVARDLVLLALLALLVAWAVRRPTATSPSPRRSLPGTRRSRRPPSYTPPRAG